MKVGILTLPLHTNYGGILQAYALQAVLGRMGHDAYVIDLERKPLRLPVWRMPVKYARRILRNLTGTPYPIFYEQKQNRELPIVRQHTDKFIERHIRRKTFAGYGSITPGDFDAIVVGSDQVWRPQYFDDIRTAYLDFAEGWPIRRMAYAASFGTDAWEYTRSKERECGRLLRMFDAVSVREASGVGLCRRHFGVEAEHVLDPTMLLKKEDYVKLFAGGETPKSSGTMLNYILDETPEKAMLINTETNEIVNADEKEIESSGTVGINNASSESEVKEVARYSVDGARISAPVKGINIVKMSDGTTRKVMIAE